MKYLIKSGEIYNIYNAFGPGLLESVYTTALHTDLGKEGLRVRREVPIPVFYKGEKLKVGFRMDLLIEEKVIIEVKSVEALAPVHHKQVITYSQTNWFKIRSTRQFQYRG